MTVEEGIDTLVERYQKKMYDIKAITLQSEPNGFTCPM